MKIRLLFFLALFCSSVAFAQTTQTVINQGRAFLVARDIVNANARFAFAVQRVPGHEQACALHALSRIAVLPATVHGQNLLNRMGVELEGRSIFDWFRQFHDPAGSG